MNDKFYIEAYCKQRNHEGERICGDVYLSKKIKEENRIILVLSDGMGHGVKANVLATLTATMALNFTLEHKEVNKIAEIIMNTLPECSDRKMSYATFTIVDIEIDGKVTIIEYDNPQTIIMRRDKMMDIKWEKIDIETRNFASKYVSTFVFEPQKEDRLIFCSDGITQSGLGSDIFPFGWGENNLHKFVHNLVLKNNEISASKLANKVVNRAVQHDAYHSKDDTSCGVIYFREPRKLLLCTGPPYEEQNDLKLADKVKNFPGKKIISGATTGDIVSRELNLKTEDGFDFIDPELPPLSYMEDIDLFTEGILTLGKVSRMLENFDNNFTLGKGPADQVIKLMLESDEIVFVIGTRINIAHQDPNLPMDLEIRRTVVKRIAKILDDKFLKEVRYEYI